MVKSKKAWSHCSNKAEAYLSKTLDTWKDNQDLDFVNQAGWYFKTVAAQIPGQDNILAASYGKQMKHVSQSTHLLPFFGTDYGLCSLIKPQITFNASLNHLPFAALMKAGPFFPPFTNNVRTES